MTNSKGSSVVIGNERAQDALLAVVVMPDGSSEGEQSLQYPSHDTLGSVSPVSFQVELAFQGLIDRLDHLTEWLQESRPWSRSLALLRRTDESRTLGGQEALELGTGIALVGQDDLTRSIGEQILVDLEQVSGHFSLVDLGICQCEGNLKTGRGADQMQSQSPEVAGVAGAIAIAGEAGEVTSSDCRTGTSTLDRGRVDHPGVVVPEVSILTEDPDQGVELALGLSQALVVAGLVGQIGEVPTQVLVGVAEEPGLRGEAEQRLEHRHGEELGITQPGGDTYLGPPDTKRRIGRQFVVDLHVQCGSEGVHIGVHGDLPGRIVGVSNADHGRLRRVIRGPRYERHPLESVFRGAPPGTGASRPPGGRPGPVV